MEAQLEKLLIVEEYQNKNSKLKECLKNLTFQVDNLDMKRKATLRRNFIAKKSIGSSRDSSLNDKYKPYFNARNMSLGKLLTTKESISMNKSNLN